MQSPPLPRKRRRSSELHYNNDRRHRLDKHRVGYIVADHSPGEMPYDDSGSAKTDAALVTSSTHREGGRDTNQPVPTATQGVVAWRFSTPIATSDSSSMHFHPSTRGGVASTSTSASPDARPVEIQALQSLPATFNHSPAPGPGDQTIAPRRLHIYPNSRPDHIPAPESVSRISKLDSGTRPDSGCHLDAASKSHPGLRLTVSGPDNPGFFERCPRCGCRKVERVTRAPSLP